MRHRIDQRVWICCWLLFLPRGMPAGEIESALEAIKAVGREGAGNEQASRHWREIVNAGPKALLPIFQAFQGADSTTANWLRLAVEAILERETQAGRPVEKSLFESVATDRSRPAAARDLAFEVLDQLDPTARERLLPGMLNDPSARIRREAIDWALRAMPSADRLAELFTMARDIDQVERIAKELKGLGREPDVIQHLGLITRWQIAGPFDNSGLKGFSQPLPAEVTWRDYATGHDRAVVNLYRAFNLKRGVDPETKTKAAIYALVRTEVESPTEQPVQIRAATPNAIRIWLNGQEVFAREEYHHGMKMDQHVGRGVLRAGRNEILAKICQDDRTYEWTLDWQFQMRLCDEIGGAIRVRVLTAPEAEPDKPEATKKEPMR
ncbi:MAG: GerMN domain-containing protein [Gemmataceae bacterium]|nr:GerMN domain-containing protein [Gemmataceae bacterium]